MISRYYANGECISFDGHRNAVRRTNPIATHSMELVRTSQTLKAQTTIVEGAIPL